MTTRIGVDFRISAGYPRPAEGGTHSRIRHPDKRRLRAGRYRVLYNVNGATVTVVVIRAGRLE
jgi:mRNA-degrading endonuclease RelE of RelBE toxin-antitoxin system